MQEAGETLGAIPAKSKAGGVDCNPGTVCAICDEIARDKGISFARFMELALYHPQHGYYSSGRAGIGRRGDFFTNVSVGPVFGKLLAAQFAEIWDKLGRPRGFQIVEQGAGDGTLATDVLNALRQSWGDCLRAAEYVVVEPFPVLSGQQEAKLASFGKKVTWVPSIDEMQPFTGIHFSNELFDALPVRLLTLWEDDWKELFVTAGEERFRLEARDLTSPELRVAAQGHDLRSPYQTEVSLAAPKLMQDIAGKLARGVVLAIDYGFARGEYFAPDRREGTLQVRAKHRKLDSPFEGIGHADISAHVEWTSLAEAGGSAGAKVLGFTDQHHFLTGILTGPGKGVSPEPPLPASSRALQTLLHPEMLGRNFQVLGLAKNFTESLSGFRFARDPRPALGLSD